MDSYVACIVETKYWPLEVGNTQSLQINVALTRKESQCCDDQ